MDLVLRKGEVGFNNPEAESKYPRRAENEWPIARTKWTKWYLMPQMTLTVDVRQAQESSARRQKLTYEAPGTLDNPRFIQFSTDPFNQETDITGNIVAHLAVSATPLPNGPTPTDIDLFVTLRHISPQGNKVFYTRTAGDPVPVTKG